MQGDKAAVSRPFRDFGDRATQSLRSKTPIASSYLGNEGRQMKAGAETNEGRQEQARMKAGAPKSRQEWRSCRETYEGRQMKAGAAKSRPEWRSQRETKEGRRMKAGAAKSRPEWRSRSHEGRQMKGDK